MTVQRLSNTDAFVVFDLGDDVPSAGPLRSAPKVARDRTELMARSWTYMFAAFEWEIGGASGGVNSPPAERTQAVSTSVEELRPLVAERRFLPAPGTGVEMLDLEPLRADDPRPQVWWDHFEELRGFGAAVSADALPGGLEGRSVLIEGFDGAGPSLARATYERGGRVVGIATARGSVAHPRGFDAAQLTQAWRHHGAQMVEHLEVVNQPPGELWRQHADVLFCGSKMGIVDHELAPWLQVKALVPTGAVPVTAKALATLTRAEVTVLPDFVSCAGPAFAMGADTDATADAVKAGASVALHRLLGEILDHPDGPLLAACYRAEAFLRTWRESLPFGRPLA